MSDQSAILALPYLQADQAQKHVTHNEALRRLDVLVQLAVADRDLTLPPATPPEGTRHIVGPGASGDWAGHDGQVAAWLGGVWEFFAPQPGWQAMVLDEGLVLTWTGTAWTAASALPMLGINTTADATNRLAVASGATLLTHAGAGHQLKINKATPADTASLLYQSNWSGRAEMGLAGSDAFAIKVSADGSSWTTALSLAASTGLAGGSAVQSDARDDTAGRLLKAGAFGWGANGTLTWSGSDLNPDGYTMSGAYFGSWTGLPGGIRTAYLLVLPGNDAATGFQIAFNAGSGLIWFRRRGAGVWDAWRSLVTQNTILGTVSQSSGLPTGAVIERGSNANGDYVRLADGTQLCWLTTTVSDLTTGENAMYITAANQSWTFPAAFAAAPAVTFGGRRTDRVLGASSRGAATTTSVAWRPWASANTSGSVTVDIMATGRWF